MRILDDVINSVDEAINKARENGSLEEMLNKTRTYAKKSAETIEISRKRIELLDAKTKLAKAYEKYGKLQFSAYEGDEVDEAAVTAATEEIIMLKSQVEFLDAEIEAFKAEIAAEFDSRMSAKKDDVVVEDVEVVDVTDDTAE